MNTAAFSYWKDATEIYESYRQFFLGDRMFPSGVPGILILLTKGMLSWFHHPSYVTGGMEEAVSYPMTERMTEDGLVLLLVSLLERG